MTDFVAFTDWAWLLGLVGLGIAAGIYGYVKKQPAGTDVMIDIGDQIHDGAMTFLRREYTVLSVFVVVVAIVLYFLIGRLPAGAYIFGAFSSVVAGFCGMKAATRANTRTAAAANTEGQGKALRVAFFGGAVMGLSVASLGLLGLGVLYFVFAASAVPCSRCLAPDVGGDQIETCRYDVHCHATAHTSRAYEAGGGRTLPIGWLTLPDGVRHRRPFRRYFNAGRTFLPAGPNFAAASAPLIPVYWGSASSVPRQ